VEWDGETGGVIQCNSCSELRLDMPVEFDGQGKGPCPDQLFLASISGCLLTTFLHFARRLGVDVRSINIRSNAELSMGEEGYRIRMVSSRILFAAAPEATELAERCARLSKEYCHITRSLEASFPVNVEIEARARP
jgi:organic hydroperoxide reductase OsmC/OhrA